MDPSQVSGVSGVWSDLESKSLDGLSELIILNLYFFLWFSFSST